jgi:hypothetical protein
MTMDDEATRAWAIEKKACWEIVPLVERHHGELMQVGFDLSLFARIPDLPAGDERFAEVHAMWDRLREIADSLGGLLAGDGRIEVDPFEEAGRLRPETGFAPEIMLQARLFHSAEYFTPPSAADRARLRPIEQRLGELGLHAKAW